MSHPIVNDKPYEKNPKTAVRNPKSIVTGMNSSIRTFANSAVGEKYPKVVSAMGRTATCADNV